MEGEHIITINWTPYASISLKMEANSTPASTELCSSKGEETGKTMEREGRHTLDANKGRLAFHELQLKQMRAQCLVYLAFRNQTTPKKLHLEIALGNSSSNEDGSYSKDVMEKKGREECVNEEKGSSSIIKAPIFSSACEDEVTGQCSSAIRIVSEPILMNENQTDSLPYVSNLNLEENVLKTGSC